MVARCWQTKHRDRLAWWLFSKVAHRDVARIVKRDYESSRDCVSVTWVFKDGSASHHKVPGLPG